MNDEIDLSQFKSALLSGLSLGAGSMTLSFSTGAWIVMQGPFLVTEQGVETAGHGEDVHSSVGLFGLLNAKVEHVGISAERRLTFRFDGRRTLSISADDNGLESFVVHTDGDIFPV